MTENTPERPAADELRVLDAQIHAIRGLDRPPSREYAMAKVGEQYVSSSGPVFRLHTWEDLLMPPGDTLPQPEGSDYWNDRYYLYVAQFLGDRIASEVDAYRMPAPHYSRDWHAAGELLDWLAGQGYAPTLSCLEGSRRWYAIVKWSVSKLGRIGPTGPETLARAVVAAFGKEASHER